MNLLKFLIHASGRTLVPSCVAGAISGIGTVAIISLIRSGLANFGSDSSVLAWEFVALCVVVLTSGVVSQLLLVRFSQQAILDLRLRLGRQILAAPLREVEVLGAARLTSVLSEDVNVLANCFIILPGLFVNLAIILTCFAYMCWLSGTTFAYVLLFIVFGVASYHLPNSYAWKKFGAARQLQDKLFVHFRALTEGFKELKLHSWKRDAFLKLSLEATATEFRQRSVAGLTVYSVASSWGQLLFFLLIAFLLFFLARMRHMDYGTLSGYVLICLFLMAPLGALLAMLPVFGKASVAFKNLEGLGLSLASEKVKPIPLASHWTGRWGEIRLEAVQHTYSRDGEDRPFRMGPINLSFLPGEVVFLAGGNGSGKTTLAKILTSLYTPECGQIRFDGELITEENRESYRNHFAAVFSDFYLFESLSGIGLEFDEEKANQYLAELRIGNRVSVKNGAFSATALSQGQRKRLALLTSFLEDRDFYIFDEWAADQDPVFKDVFYTQILPDLKKRGKTVLAITHDDKYFGTADRLIKMESGQVLSDVHQAFSSRQIVSNSGPNGRHAPQPEALHHLPAPGKEDMNSTVLVATEVKKTTKKAWGPSVAVLALTSAFVWIVCGSLKPPTPVTAVMPLGEFSTTRALAVLNEIAVTPHPIGTAGHQRVQQFIVEQLRALGLAPSIQQGVAANPDFGRKTGLLTPVGFPQNIVVTLPGTSSAKTKSVLISAHYDSVATGVGASDDGAAVAAALETIRALRAGPPLLNDVVFLFTDLEEAGLLGASEFADSGSLQNIGLVLNFDARGTGGQDLMFETGPGNDHLIDGYARVAPYPSASSLGYEIYKHLPNDTDFTEFKAKGIPGLNFAFIKDYAYYHTAKDNLEDLDRGSLQQMGANMLALARHFGSNNLTEIRGSRDAVFFSVPGWRLVRYSGRWITAQIIFVVALFLSALVFGLRNKTIRFWGVAFGAAVSFLVTLAALLAVSLAWAAIIYFIHPSYRQIVGGNSYNSGVYIAALCALGLSIVSSIYRWALKRSGVLSLAMGAALFWFCFLVLSAAFFPGASYIFAWPLCFCLIAFLGQMMLKQSAMETNGPDYRRLAFMAVGTIPAILIAVPVLNLVFLGLTLLGSGVAAAIIALFMGLLLPQYHALFAGQRKIFALTALLIFVCCLAIGESVSGFSESHPRPDSLMYALNPEKNSATWVSFDSSPDMWTAKFIPAQAESRQLEEYFPFSQRKFRIANAPVLPLSAPQAVVLEDQTADGIRTLKLKISSPRLSPELSVSCRLGERLRTVTLDGHPIPLLDQMAAVLRKRNVWGIDFTGLPETGVVLVLQMTPGPISLTFVDESYGFPEPLASSMPSRPTSIMAHPIPINDKTYVTVTKTF